MLSLKGDIPLSPEKEKKMSHIQIRIEESLKQKCQRAASELSLPLAAWIRLKLIEALRAEEERSSTSVNGHPDSRS